MKLEDTLGGRGVEKHEGAKIPCHKIQIEPGSLVLKILFLDRA